MFTILLKSIGVPITTTSQSVLLIVVSRSLICWSPYPIAGNNIPISGYFSNVAAISPTANGRGSTNSEAPNLRAATTPAPSKNYSLDTNKTKSKAAQFDDLFSDDSSEGDGLPF